MSNPIIKRFLKQTEFSSEEDYSQHLEFIIPKNFNFAYDVVDEWAKLAPQKIALLWTNDTADSLAADIERMNSQLSHPEQVKRFKLVSTPLSISRGELTPNLKVKRNVVLEHYKQEIEALYS